ncbi:MAG: NrdH-redoxin, partial [Caldimonas sp.]
MDLRACFSPTGLVPRAAFALVFALAAAPSLAQFKVIGPDGKVTYTDREPSQTEGRVIPLGNRAVTQAAEPELPFELRQPASKYPVTLYVTSSACDPCTSARQML